MDGSYDEVFAEPGRPREHARALATALAELGPDALSDAGRLRDSIFMQQGITFDAGGPDADGPVRDRPFPLDLVPRIIPGGEWRSIKRGLAQRIRALNAFVDDVYHAREIVHEGIVPWELIVSRSAFARAAHGIRPPGGVYCHVSGCDLVRDADGSWKVLEDNVRTPSGISYVLENRVAMTRLLPGLFGSYRVRPVDHYPALLRTALTEVAPTSAEEEATVVVWTPGPFNSAYFEHAFLARQMGVELVEASDLVVRDATCYIRTTDGLQRVHAIYRRIDDDFMDPLEFRPDSLLGVAGLMRAYRAGAVAIVNAVGTGVADDKAVYPHVPEMIRFYLGEEPILDNVRTYLMADPEQRRAALERLDQLVVKPVDESGGKGVFIGPDRRRRGDRPPGGGDPAPPGALDRAGARPALDLPDRLARRRAGAAARRPAPVRGLRRGHPHRPRRAHAGRAARGLDDRQLLPGRRLEGHVGAGGAGRRGDRGAGAGERLVAAGAARPAPGRRLVGPAAAATAAAGLMLARIAHELYWIGRQLSRAEHTARMLDGVFHADVQGRRDDPGVRLSWDALLAIMGVERPDRTPTRDEVVQRLTLDRSHDASVASCVTQAREGARTVRDVFSAEMWEAINTFHLGLLRRDNSAALRTGPYSVYAYVKERCGLFWGVTGRTMLRDEAHAFLEAGARIEAGDMVLRMLRVALPAGEDDGSPDGDHARDGQALALLQAVGGFQAYRRAVPAPPNAGPVGRFLLYERAYPDSVAASVEALHSALTEADANYRNSAAGAAPRQDPGRPRLPLARARGPRRRRRPDAGPRAARAGAGRRRHLPALLRRRVAAGS